jgi:hypothetical protein
LVEGEVRIIHRLTPLAQDWERGAGVRAPP